MPPPKLERNNNKIHLRKPSSAHISPNVERQNLLSSLVGPDASRSQASQSFSNRFETLLRQHENKQPLAGAAGRWVHTRKPGALA